MVKVFYRISDKGNPKGTLPYAGKLKCLENTIKEFGHESIHVIADNCLPQTIDFLKNKNLSFEETSLGNFGSFKYMILEKILNESDETIVYLLEDDYIHREGSKKSLIEGLKIADYVSLYDHPDKYMLNNDNGNPFNINKLQTSQIFVSESCHWRTTNSTPMTFACKVGILRKDFKVFFRYSMKNKSPKSLYVFSELTRQTRIHPLFLFLSKRNKRLFFITLKNYFKKYKRILITSIPAYATHCHEGTLAPLIKWENI
ncbi:MAG: hypothetical protein LBQ28_05370 [Prevotellaceae bacterium]|jgi:hypothetical protein|nr:hypothetical protein [Prevotellaceae bacterium]